MAPAPELLGHRKWIELALLPPSPLIACGMVLMMVDGAKRHGELVAHLKAESPRLRKADVVRACGRAATDQAGLAGDEPQVLL